MFDSLQKKKTKNKKKKTTARIYSYSIIYEKKTGTTRDFSSVHLKTCCSKKKKKKKKLFEYYTTLQRQFTMNEKSKSLLCSYLTSYM